MRQYRVGDTLRNAKMGVTITITKIHANKWAPGGSFAEYWDSSPKGSRCFSFAELEAFDRVPETEVQRDHRFHFMALIDADLDLLDQVLSFAAGKSMIGDYVRGEDLRQRIQSLRSTTP